MMRIMGGFVQGKTDLLQVVRYFAASGERLLWLLNEEATTPLNANDHQSRPTARPK
ncbi:MAG: hypothetical protein R3C56_27665 [Pirellulaceae bacterium]